jgi:hypothetical protein
VVGGWRKGKDDRKHNTLASWGMNVFWGLGGGIEALERDDPPYVAPSSVVGGSQQLL